MNEVSFVNTCQKIDRIITAPHSIFNLASLSFWFSFAPEMISAGGTSPGSGLWATSSRKRVVAPSHSTEEAEEEMVMDRQFQNLKGKLCVEVKEEAAD